MQDVPAKCAEVLRPRNHLFPLIPRIFPLDIWSVRRKTILLRRLLHAEPHWGRGQRVGNYIKEGVTYALVLTIQEFSQNSRPSVKNKATKAPLGVLYAANGFCGHGVHEACGHIYLHRRGVSALLVSTDRAMREAFELWNERESDSTFSFPIMNPPVLESAGTIFFNT